MDAYNIADALDDLSEDLKSVASLVSIIHDSFVNSNCPELNAVAPGIGLVSNNLDKQLDTLINLTISLYDLDLNTRLQQSDVVLKTA